MSEKGVPEVNVLVHRYGHDEAEISLWVYDAIKYPVYRISGPQETLLEAYRDLVAIVSAVGTRRKNGALYSAKLPVETVIMLVPSWETMLRGAYAKQVFEKKGGV